jgi:hypothetical protein
MRTFSAAALIMLAACTQDATGTPPDDENLVECALSGSTAFARDCAVERWRDGNGAFLVVRHPDGGFRRFQVLEDGGLTTADGAEAARVAPREGGIEVAVAADRYRLPATITDHDGE